MISSIIFSIVKTRSDITFATSMKSLFVKNLDYQYTKEVKIVLQYLKSSRE